MNILVCISNVPDTTSKIEFLNDSTKFNNEGHISSILMMNLDLQKQLD